MNKQSLPPFITNWLAPRKLKIEIGFVAVSILSLFIFAIGIEGGAELLMISLSALSGFYFISGYLPSDFGSGVLAMIAYKMISFSSAVSVIGLLFSVLKLSGSGEMIFIGFIVMSLATLILVGSAMKQWNDKMMPLFMRVAVLLTVSALVQFKVIQF